MRHKMLHNNNMILLWKSRKLLNIPVILIGDINQNIYQFQGGSDKFLREHPGKKIILVENNRSTEEIVISDALKPLRWLYLK